MGFQHMEFDVSLARVTVFRDSLVEVLQDELGVNQLHSRAREAWMILLNYIGGAFIYVRVKYAERLRILSSSWATANNKLSEDTITLDVQGEEEAAEGENAEGGSGEAGAGNKATGKTSGESGQRQVSNFNSDAASNQGDQ